MEKEITIFVNHKVESTAVEKRERKRSTLSELWQRRKPVGVDYTTKTLVALVGAQIKTELFVVDGNATGN